MMFHRAALFLTAFSTFHGADAIASSHLLEEFDLKNVKTFEQSLKENVITTADGVKYSFKGKLRPESDMFDSEYFVANDDGSQVLDVRSGETFDIPVSQVRYDDGAVVKMYNDQQGEVEYAEVHRKGPDGKHIPTTLLVKKDGQTFETFEDTDLGGLGTAYKGDTVMPPKNGGRNLRSMETEENDDMEPPTAVGMSVPLEDLGTNVTSRELTWKYKRGDGHSRDCSRFKTVKIAIVYDALFCNMHGGPRGAYQEVLKTVAGASQYYENDMCLKFVVTNIKGNCDVGTDPFRFFPTETACHGQNNLLNRFTLWLQKERASQGIPNAALVHLFTGAKIESAAVGCAYRGQLCKSDWATAVDYMRFGNLRGRMIMFAHETGHIMGLRHLVVDHGQFIMREFVSRGTDGIAQTSIDTVLAKLETTGCDRVARARIEASPVVDSSSANTLGGLGAFFWATNVVALLSLGSYMIL